MVNIADEKELDDAVDYTPKIASVKNLRRPQKTASKPSALKKLMFLSKDNIDRRQGRELVVSNTISPQSPMDEKGMQPFMETYRQVAETTVNHIDSNLSFLEKEFNGVELYRLTEANVKKSIKRVTENVFAVTTTRQLVNTMMKNMDARKVFADKLVRVRIATAANDVATLVEELMELAKFFHDDIWSTLNVVSEKIYDKTGFAVGAPIRKARSSKKGLKAKIKNTLRGFELQGFTRTFHLQWMRLLKDPFVHSVMGAVAGAAKSLASYKEINAEFIKKRKGIEETIGSNPVLEQLRKKLSAAYDAREQTLLKCDALAKKLEQNKKCPRQAMPITEAEVQAARSLDSDLDYKIEQTITQYEVAIEATQEADKNAAAATLPGHAIQMHVRAIAKLFFSSGQFILDTADYFTAKQLLVAAGQANQLAARGDKIAGMSQVKDDINKLSQTNGKMKTAMSNLDKQVSVKVRDKQTGEERVELIWIAFEITSSPKTCTACSENIPEKTTIARPHYPCLPHYPGEPEVIHDGQRTVVAGAYICHACVSESLAKLNELQNSGEWQYEPEKTYVRKIKRAA